MAKGIIYLMTTVVPGLVKIGKTGTDQFENRMKFLESNDLNATTQNMAVRKIRESLRISKEDKELVLQFKK